MLIKSALANDYSGVSTVPSTRQPASAIEFIQKVSLIDYQSVTGGGVGPVTAASGNPTSMIVDAPSWANFFRYKTIQFSFGAFAPNSSDNLYLNFRKNTQLINATKVFTYYGISGTSSNINTATSAAGTSAVLISPISYSQGSSSTYVQALNVFVRQIGATTEADSGNLGSTFSSANIKCNISIQNLGIANYNVPIYLEGDNPGVVISFSGARIGAPHGTASNSLVNYKLDCSIYGWLR